MLCPDEWKSETVVGITGNDSYCDGDKSWSFFSETVLFYDIIK